MAAVEQTIQYKRELLAGDIVTVHSVLLEIKEKVVRFSTRCARRTPTKLPQRRH